LQVYHSISISHKEASINDLSKVIETLPSDKTALFKHLQNVKANLQLEELFVLTTCNRLLVIFVQNSVSHELVTESFIEQLLSNLLPSKHLPITLKQQFSYRNHKETVQHTFELATGLDSMVLGEHEILGQVKKAYNENKAYKLTGDHIRILIEYVISSAKYVFSNTDLGKNSVSVVALAINNLKDRNFSKNAKIVLIGAGETIATVTKFLFKLGFENVTIYNRTIDRAYELVKPFKGHAYSIDKLKEINTLEFDILISCVTHCEPLIDADLLQKNDRTKRLVIDLGVPANIDCNVETIPNLSLINMQYLQNQSKLNLEKRGLSLGNATKLLHERITEFNAVFKERQLEKVLAAIHQKIKKVKEKALSEVFKKEIKALDENAQNTLLDILNYFEKKSIGIPMIEAKKALNENKLSV